MTAFYAVDPINSTQFIPGGNVPASGGLLFCYLVGSTTKQNTYTDASASTARTNPIVLDSGGNVPGNGEVWITSTAKFVLAPSNDSDPPASPYWSRDNLPGVNDPSQLGGEWITSGLVPTFVNGSTFVLGGDQTGTFTPQRRLKAVNTAGLLYSTVTSSVFATSTTIGIVSDTLGLDAGLSSISYGMVGTKSDSLPYIVSPQRFGAKGDGITNDAIAIQAAFDSIKHAGGGMLYVPPGRYNVSTQIVLDQMPMYRVMGAGGKVQTRSTQTEFGNPTVFVNSVNGTMFLQQGTTVANQIVTGPNIWEHVAFEGYNSSTNNIAFDSQNGYDKTVFEHCSFLGGKYGWTSTPPGTFDVLFSDVDFFNIVNGCFLSSTAGSDFLQLRWEDCIARFNGYFVDAGAGNSFYFKNCLVEACTSGGIRLDSVFTSKFENCHFEQNSIGSANNLDIEIKATSAQPKNLVVDGCTFTMDTTNNQVKQVLVTDTNKMLFSGNRSIGTGVATASFNVSTAGGREVVFLENSLDVPYVVTGATELKVVPYISTSPYTPTFSTTGNAPVLANATLVGRYQRLGNLVHTEINFVAGSSTTFGTGTFLFSLPIQAAATFNTHHAMRIIDAGVGNMFGFAQIAANAVNVSLLSSSFINVNSSVPMSWTTSDAFDLTVDYFSI